MNLEITKTYTFTQQNVLELIVDYLDRTHGIQLKTTDLTVRIRDSQSDYHGPDTPAYIESISFTDKTVNPVAKYNGPG